MGKNQKMRDVVIIPEEKIDHPQHYGGADNLYEAINVIEAWQLNICLGNVLKYISRAGKKGTTFDDLKKAQWYLEREIRHIEMCSISTKQHAAWSATVC